MRKWLITGVSSGFGRMLAEAALEQGDSVVGTLRKTEQAADFEALAPGRAKAVVLDVTDLDRIDSSVEEAIAALGNIDVLVNNAGYGLFGALEEVSSEEILKVMDTNFTGALFLTRAVIPYMRRSGGGHIVNFSSMAGIVGIPGGSIYSAAKFALEGLSEALAGELAPFGIRVTLVEPGGFRTNFAGGSLALAKQQIKDYAATPAGQARTHMSDYLGQEPGDPAKGAQAILHMLESPQPPLRLVLGADAVAAIRGKLKRVHADIDAWEDVAVNTAI